jgi:hypothetical protein
MPKKTLKPKNEVATLQIANRLWIKLNKDNKIQVVQWVKIRDEYEPIQIVQPFELTAWRVNIKLVERVIENWTIQPIICVPHGDHVAYGIASQFNLKIVTYQDTDNIFLQRCKFTEVK